jgi:hypothetical protein
VQFGEKGKKKHFVISGLKIGFFRSGLVVLGD